MTTTILFSIFILTSMVCFITSVILLNKHLSKKFKSKDYRGILKVFLRLFFSLVIGLFGAILGGIIVCGIVYLIMIAFSQNNDVIYTAP